MIEVVEGGMNWAVAAMVLVLRSIGHELVIRTLARRVKALMLAEVG